MGLYYNGLGDRTSQYVYLTRPGTSVLSGTIYYYYDGKRQLKKVMNPAGIDGGDSIRFTYDAAGNRLKRIKGPSSYKIYTYNAANNQMTVQDQSPSLPDPYEYSYDDNGNLTQSFDEPGTRTYAYDFENRLTKVKQGSDSTVFFYNGDGVRLKKLGTKDSSLQYIPDGMYTAVERRTNGNIRYKYVYANGMLLARIDSTGRKFYYHHDALGSIVGVSDSTYAVWKSFLYDEFGDSLGAWGATSINNYRYTGQEYDITPVNAYNLRAREYYPKLGRFMQNDPIGDKGGCLNWYSYVANNPINWTDPTGKYVYVCQKWVYGLIPHRFIKVGDNDDMSQPTWGFYPDVNILQHGFVIGGYNAPGQIKSPDPANTSPCWKITTDKCHDDCVKGLAAKRMAAPAPNYNFYKYNCWDWVLDILHDCGL